VQHASDIMDDCTDHSGESFSGGHVEGVSTDPEGFDVRMRRVGRELEDEC
jgi:hypothetical protein